MAIRILVTDGMDASAVETLRNDGYEIVFARRDDAKKAEKES